MKVTTSNSGGGGGGAPPSSRYKTELCRPFEEFGTCKYGDKCQFAHGAAELRRMTRHPKYKTEQCKTFHTLGLCPYGHRCHFIHNETIVQMPRGRSNNIMLTSGGSTSSTTSSSSSPSPPLSASPTGSFEDQMFDQSTHQQQFSPRLPIFTSFFPQLE
ncbi:unnamed protein product [Allacma fusca]|uniref:C3H1-type domain-containing protein n=1 Tax=Allacma fusca TaxID=39272 RepID=A0A8J2MHH7_9HEXA|nr:unnamed protein product [Allacma fusca]